MRKVRTPFLIVNPKSYLYGEKSLELAKAADRVAEDTGVEIFFTCPFADIRYIAENTKNIIVTAQYMESLKAAGAEAVFLNHAENSCTVAELYATMNRAKELEMITVVCADSVVESRAIAEMKPNILLSEPTDLIGTGETADDSYVLETTEQIHAVNPEILVMIASGVNSPEDVYNIIKLGADGTGATSGIIGAPDPARMVREMAEAMAKADKEKKGEQCNENV